MRHISPAAAAATLALLLTLGTAAAEHIRPDVWNARLALPAFVQEPALHTPIIPNGTYLPPVIAYSRTITAAQSPVLLAGTTKIPKGVTLTIDPGVSVYALEYGDISVDGTLIVNGTNTNGVYFSTNESNIANRNWAGIILQPGSRARIAHATIRHASPAISCITGTQAQISHSTLELGNVGLYTETPRCVMVNSTIRNTDKEVVTRQ